MRLDGVRASFVVEDVEHEQPRYAARDIHPTGLLPGKKTVPSQANALALENEIYDTLEIGHEQLETLSLFAPGTRRDLVIFPAELSWESSGENSLKLSFFLPSGSYATQLVRELTRTPFFSPRGQENTPAPTPPSQPKGVRLT